MKQTVEMISNNRTEVAKMAKWLICLDFNVVLTGFTLKAEKHDSIDKPTEEGNNLNPKFTAKIKNSEEEITGYYCRHIFGDDITHTPAITVIEAINIEVTYQIEPETLRPAEEG
jgi:hypothetical protein